MLRRQYGIRPALGMACSRRACSQLSVSSSRLSAPSVPSSALSGEFNEGIEFIVIGMSFNRLSVISNSFGNKPPRHEIFDGTFCARNLDCLVSEFLEVLGDFLQERGG